MDFKSVKQLADLMEERGLVQIEVQDGDQKISLSRQVDLAALAAMQLPAAAPAPAPQPAAAAPAPAAEAPEEKAGEALTSPIVGTVYLAAAPGEAPFVKPGDRVKKGQTLCIVEAMKVMNEYAAPRDGAVDEICVEDGQLVEYGQCLLRLA